MHPEELSKPYAWRGSKVVFVNSMSDLFHENVSFEFIEAVFKVMNDLPQHQFQVLTKRAERLALLSSKLTWTKNIWMGVSVESQKVLDRVDFLRCSDAQIKFLSLEPLLGPLPGMNLRGIDWVIVGGESGRKARPISKEWIIDIKNQCEMASVAFFFKQWGGTNKKAAGRMLEGKTYDEMPQLA
jgi:protein gp37